MEENKEPMVTITLGEYNKLRDKSNDNMRLYDRMSGLENRMREIDRSLLDLENRKVNK